MPERYYNSSTYRYGFNGMEADDEIKSDRNALEFGGRSIYDGRLGRFVSVDDYAKVTPNKSPYSFAGNSPIAFIDKDGGFQLSPDDKKSYPVLNNILQNLYQYATENPKVIEAFVKNSGLDKQRAMEYIEYAKSSPTVQVGTVNGMAETSKAGQIKFNVKDAIKLEKHKTKVEQLIAEGADESKILKAKQKFAKKVASAVVTVLHEGVHKGDIEVNGMKSDGQIKADNPKQGPSRNNERGYDFEEDAYGEVLIEQFIDKNDNFTETKSNPDNFLKKMANVVFKGKSEKK